LALPKFNKEVSICH